MMSRTPGTIAHRIATARHSLGLTQAKLADMLGVSSQAVNQWENGRTQPSKEHLVRLSKLTKRSLQSLIVGHEALAGTRSVTHQADDVPGELPLASGAGPIKVMMTDPELVITNLSGHAVFSCGPRAFAVFAEDDSNAPAVPKGSRMVFDPDRKTRPGMFVVATFNGKAVMGVFHHEALADRDVKVVKPINAAWPAARSDRGKLVILGVRTELTTADAP